jgi:hypothetical protein
MKKLILLFFVAGFMSCQKGEVPDSKSRYIGEWTNTNNLDAQFKIIINANGTAEYHELNGGQTLDITGYVFFSGDNFKIGSKNFAGKKIKTNSSPERVTITEYKTTGN